MEGIELGRQSVLIGGGLGRSAGGWSMVRSLCKSGMFQKSDERILGDGNFVESVLFNAHEVLDKRYHLSEKGVTLEDVVSDRRRYLCHEAPSVHWAIQQTRIVKGRALICFWAVHELGLSMTNVAEYFKVGGAYFQHCSEKG